jgi:hypothetical protein
MTELAALRVAFNHLNTKLDTACGQLAIANQDSERLDFLSRLYEPYGFEGEHLGNRWLLEGPFRDIREAIDSYHTAFNNEQHDSSLVFDDF